MRYTEPNEPRSRMDLEEGPDERLRRENEELRRQLAELRGGARPSASPGRRWRPTGAAVTAIVLGAVTLVAIAFFAGYIPYQKKRTLIMDEAHQQERALPRVQVFEVRRAAQKNALELPGNIQAITEAPILARAEGYIRSRFVDLGDRVRAGQPLAEIDAPELDEQVRQARAALDQTRAALDQAQANLQQGRSDLELARLTAQRWGTLVKQGAVSRQENDQYQTQYQARTASVQSLEKAVNVQRSNIAAAEANVARLQQMQAYRTVRAPFDGVITLRNVDTGALVNAGNTLLFRIAQTNTLRIYVSVPQANASSVRAGQTATLTVSNFPGRVFHGTVARSASALDPASRTMLVEVQVRNGDGALLPGMYAQVDLSSNRASANVPLVIPGDALVVRSNGSQVAVVENGGTVRLKKIEVGRDYGDRLEVLGGLAEGELVIQNPGDVVREGLRVEPVKMPAHEPEPGR